MVLNPPKVEIFLIFLKNFLTKIILVCKDLKKKTIFTFFPKTSWISLLCTHLQPYIWNWVVSIFFLCFYSTCFQPCCHVSASPFGQRPFIFSQWIHHLVAKQYNYMRSYQNESVVLMVPTVVLHQQRFDLCNIVLFIFGQKSVVLFILIVITEPV